MTGTPKIRRQNALNENNKVQNVMKTVLFSFRPVEMRNRPVEVPDRPVEIKNKPVEIPNRPVEMKNRPVVSTNQPVGMRNRPVVSTFRPVVSILTPYYGGKKRFHNRRMHIQIKINRIRSLKGEGFKISQSGTQEEGEGYDNA
jgi:hypothetical protein